MEFFDKLGKKATEAYKITADKTGKIAKETKLKLKISSLRTQVSELYEEIGKKVYEEHIREDKQAKEDIEQYLEELCTKIDVLSDEIEDLLQQCLELRDKKQCINCYIEMDKECNYCPNCGTKQDKEENFENVSLFEGNEEDKKEEENKNEENKEERTKQEDSNLDNLEKTVKVESNVENNEDENKNKDKKETEVEKEKYENSEYVEYQDDENNNDNDENSDDTNMY